MSNEQLTAAEDILRRIVEEITSHHEEIKIFTSHLGSTLQIKLQVHKGDMRRVLGRRGAHVKALETVLRGVGAKVNVPLQFQLLEPEVGHPDMMDDFAAKKRWPKKRIRDLFEDIAEATFFGESEVEVFDDDSGSSAIEIRVGHRHRLEYIERMQEALGMLGRAIGRANGRLVSVVILKKDE